MILKSRLSVMGSPHPPALLVVFIILVFTLLQSGCATKTPPETAPPQTTQLPPAEPPASPPQDDEDIDPGLPVTAPLKTPKIVIKKAKKKLFLYSEEKLLRTYPVKLGFNPVGDKVRKGDKRTPEGSYYICMKNPRSKYHLSLGLSYPSIEDAERGLEQKLITKSDHDRIIERISKKSIPPWDTPLGGEIFIHGGGETWDWTYGCVAMCNKDIEELFKVIALGTEVVIQQ
ncbi:MAG: L,D-transpeptidase [Desulfobulbaceae bacterium]|nr:L,D-transpeptidase [Desulfobulbaceae bacterium]HIJ91099.1 L,D-transpeptidase [Deltaproteobacteria bacterium]